MSVRDVIQAAAGAGGGSKLYVEDVFSTYLYDGNSGSTRVIDNKLKLTEKGGLVWIKTRNDSFDHALTDTARGNYNLLRSNDSAPESPGGSGVYFSSPTGFDLTSTNITNASGRNYVSWSFVKQPKFFDIVTYTGNGVARTISHSLGSVPGCIIVKRRDNAVTSDWRVYHRSLSSAGNYLALNTNGFQISNSTIWNSTAPTSTVFSVGTDSTVNANGGTYVAYLFAHNAGGFGDDGLQNVIECGVFYSQSSFDSVATFGFEPQWIMAKNIAQQSNWVIIDRTRGIISNGFNDPAIFANTNGGDTFANNVYDKLTQKQWLAKAGSGLGEGNCIYIAVRRGPMKTPTSGTEVLSSTAYTGNGGNDTAIAGVAPFEVDTVLLTDRNANSLAWTSFAHYSINRDIGVNFTLSTSKTDGQTTGWQTYHSFSPRSDVGNWGLYGSNSNASYMNRPGTNYVAHKFRRNPKVFDVVNYSGTGSTLSVPHSLEVTPELIIVKSTSGSTPTGAWLVWTTGFTLAEYLILNSNASKGSAATFWGTVAPNSTSFQVGPSYANNWTNTNYIGYLFATLAGVSKVGTYTGNGSNQTINCGFSNGVRYILVKRVDSPGNWFFTDTARGIPSGFNDFVSAYNDANAEYNYIDVFAIDPSGFIVKQEGNTNLNVFNGTYIYLALA